MIYNSSTGEVTGTPTSGNPTSYYNGTRWSLDWAEGRNLISAEGILSTGSEQEQEVSVSYTYDADGLRTGKTVTVETYEQVEHTHEYAVTETVEPTCEAGGTVTYTCGCGDSYQETVNATGHNGTVIEVTEPTCTAKGYTTYQCETCGITYQGDETAALGHNYSIFNTCIRCGDRRENAIIPTQTRPPIVDMGVEGEVTPQSGEETGEELLEAETSLEGYVEESIQETEAGQSEDQAGDTESVSETTLEEEMGAESSLEALTEEENQTEENTEPEETTESEENTEESADAESMAVESEAEAPISEEETVAEETSGEEETVTEEEVTEEEVSEEESAEPLTTTIRTLVSTTTEHHDYIYAGGKLLRDIITTTIDGTTTTQTLDFRYDENGHPYEMIRTVGETTTSYYYITNLQGDVMHLVDGDGTAVASYTYDPYGNILTATGELAEVNPLRYRGYYYDEETGFYYLLSRYYDAEIERFLNADSYISTGQSFLGYNAFAYCGNNPVNRVDADGEAWETVIDILSLGYSALEVIENPKDGWAWAGFARDLLDLIPFVTGIGEATRAVSTMAEVADVMDDTVDAVTSTKKSLKAIKNAAENLPKGNNTVYVSFKGDTLEYVGITNDFVRRSGEWDGVRVIEEYVTGLDRTSARYVEQAVIDTFGMAKKGGVLSNKINSIGIRNPKYKGYRGFLSTIK